MIRSKRATVCKATKSGNLLMCSVISFWRAPAAATPKNNNHPTRFHVINQSVSHFIRLGLCYSRHCALLSERRGEKKNCRLIRQMYAHGSHLRLRRKIRFNIVLSFCLSSTKKLLGKEDPTETCDSDHSRAVAQTPSAHIRRQMAVHPDATRNCRCIANNRKRKVTYDIGRLCVRLRPDSIWRIAASIPSKQATCQSASGYYRSAVKPNEKLSCNYSYNAIKRAVH